MNLLAIGFGTQELLLILAIVLLLFGSTRLPQLAKGLGKSIREFKKGASELEIEELEEKRRENLRAGASSLEESDYASNKIPVNKTR